MIVLFIGLFFLSIGNSMLNILKTFRLFITLKLTIFDSIYLNNIYDCWFYDFIHIIQPIQANEHHSAGSNVIAWWRRKNFFFQEMNDKQSSNKIVQINHIVVSMYQWRWSLSSNIANYNRIILFQFSISFVDFMYFFSSPLNKLVRLLY